MGVVLVTAPRKLRARFGMDRLPEPRTPQGKSRFVAYCRQLGVNLQPYQQRWLESYDRDYPPTTRIVFNTRVHTAEITRLNRT